jgi:uncharacterized repeat protein (TIGR01451 family)
MTRSRTRRRHEISRVRRVAVRLRIEVMESRELLSTFIVTNTSDNAIPATNSLRWAITQVNKDATPDTIDIEITAGGFQSIQLSSALPALTNAVTIDGTKEQGFNSVPLIELDGSNLGSSSNGLVLSGGQSTVQGLAIVGFTGSAIVLNTQGGDVVAGNYLGVTTSGNLADANGQGISIIGTSNNTIGGSVAAAGNLIAGNLANGIQIEAGNGGAAANEITANLIGTNASGSAALANGQAGIEIDGATGTLIGLPQTGLANVVAGNLGPGIKVTANATGTVIQSNFIGLAANGTTVIGNGGDGIWLDDAPSATIGGTAASQGNLIGGNEGNGIETSNGTIAVIEGNAIGSSLTGTRNLGNRGNGIQLASSSNTIGGTASGAGNTIDDNGNGQIGSGIQLVGSVNQNEILSNSIFGNGGLGINLGDGPTPNHAPGTSGPNDYQNYPTLSLAQSNGSTTTINGSLYSIPTTTFMLQFFASPSASQNGFGQGKQLVGSESVATDQNGNATFSVPLPEGVAPGAYISATATDPLGNTSEFAADVQTLGQINLSLVATGTPNPVPAGGDLTYLFTLTNSGTIAATNVTLTDQLPPSVTLVSASVSQGFTHTSLGGTTVSASLGMLNAGVTATLTIVVQTSAASVGTISDTASGSSGGDDPVSATVTTTVQAAADLSVVMTSAPGPIFAGGDLTDTITITNSGPETATGVTASLPLPTGVSYISEGQGSPPVTNSNGQLVIDMGTIASGASATVSLVVQPTITGTLTQTVTVSSSSYDPTTANDSSTTTTPVSPGADLGVIITGSAGSADTIDNFTYTVVVTNNGPGNDTGVVMNDTLPAGVTVVSLSSQNGVPTQSGGTVSLSIGLLNEGATATMTIVVTPTVAPGTEMVDSATVGGDLGDAVQGNNTASLTTPVVGVSDLGVMASAPAGPFYVGQNVVYSLIVSNQGPDLEPNATVTCPVSASVAFASASNATSGQASVTNGVLTDQLGPLAAGATETVTIVLVPQGAAAGSLTTDFAIQGENVDTDSSNDSAQVTVNVIPAADLSILISTAANAPAVQADWSYTLNVGNVGLSNATDVTVDSQLPSNVQVVSVTCSQGSYEIEPDGTLQAALGSFAAGQAATISVVVVPTALGLMPLAASVRGDQHDPDSANNQNSETLTVAPSVNLSVALVPTSATAVVGRSLTFTATVYNAGPNPATGVALTLPMPAGFAFDSTIASAGSSGMVGGQVVATLGDVNPGSTVTVTIVVTPKESGTVTETVSVTAAENELDAANTSATSTVTVMESPGTVQFDSSLYSVSSTAGVAMLTVERTVGSLGAVTVQYQTVAVNATPGLDFEMTSGTLTFAAGQTVGMISVPILNDLWQNHNDLVNVLLSSPGGGATLGSVSTAQLTIVDVNPDMTPPEVSQLTWTGTSKAISTLNLGFNGPLDPNYAANPSNYHLSVATAGQPPISISSVSYNSSTYSVTLVLSAPISSNRFYEIQVAGTGGTAIRDLAGNLLDGASNGAAGSSYEALFGQGTRLNYVDNTGNKVSLKLSGGGYMEDVLTAQGSGQALTIIGEVPKRSTLSGTIKKTKRSSRTTNLGTIEGLGNFGDVRVSLKSPPFLVKQYPFQQRGRGFL